MDNSTLNLINEDVLLREFSFLSFLRNFCNKIDKFDWQHRYYGDSIPYGSREIAYKNASTLSYLTAEQALADYAILITELKRNLSAQACPVVLFGGSYGGSE